MTEHFKTIVSYMYSTTYAIQQSNTVTNVNTQTTWVYGLVDYLSATLERQIIFIEFYWALWLMLIPLKMLTILCFNR